MWLVTPTAGMVADFFQFYKAAFAKTPSPALAKAAKLQVTFQPTVRGRVTDKNGGTINIPAGGTLSVTASPTKVILKAGCISEEGPTQSTSMNES